MRACRQATLIEGCSFVFVFFSSVAGAGAPCATTVLVAFFLSEVQLVPPPWVLSPLPSFLVSFVDAGLADEGARAAALSLPNFALHKICPG